MRVISQEACRNGGGSGNESNVEKILLYEIDGAYNAIYQGSQQQDEGNECAGLNFIFLCS